MPPKKARKRGTPLLPPPLKPGSRVALIAPAFHFDRENFEKGKAALEKTYGLQTVYSQGIFEKHGYFAGTDGRRLDEFLKALLDDSLEGIFAIRGGFGTTHLIHPLLAELKKHRNLKPKVFVGYSDLTVALTGFFQNLGWSSFHGPVVASRACSEPLPLESDSFRRSVFTEEALGFVSHSDCQVLHPGVARGRIVGGNLAMVVASLGTPYELETQGKVLFLEDVTERPFRLDRMLTQLLHAGKLDGLEGLVLGQFTECGTPEETLWAIRSALGEFLVRRDLPTVYGFPAGHGKPQLTFPFGSLVEVSADPKLPGVVFLEPGVSLSKT